MATLFLKAFSCTYYSGGLGVKWIKRYGYTFLFFFPFLSFYCETVKTRTMTGALN